MTHLSVLMHLIVEKFIEKNRLPHLLFYGPPGTGKTSTILAVARRIYGSEYRKQILEVCPQRSRGAPTPAHARSSTRRTTAGSTSCASRSSSSPRRARSSPRA